MTRKTTQTRTATYPSAADLHRLRLSAIANLEEQLAALRDVEDVVEAELVVDEDRGDVGQLYLLLGGLLEEVEGVRADVTEGRLEVADEDRIEEELTALLAAVRRGRALAESDLLTEEELLRARAEESHLEPQNPEPDEPLADEAPITGSPGQCADGPAIRRFLFSLWDALAAAEAMADEHGSKCACWACDDARHAPYVLEGIVRNLEGSVITLSDLRASWGASRGKAAVESKRPSPLRPRVAVEP